VKYVSGALKRSSKPYDWIGFELMELFMLVLLTINDDDRL
jgi:hypothetical protein